MPALRGKASTAAPVHVGVLAEEWSLAGSNVAQTLLSASQAWVRKFTDALTTRWFDAHEILPGDRWQDKIEKALRQSRVLIMAITPESVQRPWTFFELGAALADGKRIVPVLSEERALAWVGL
jgi:hypothetical protein